jgi:hypothetical protein
MKKLFPDIESLHTSPELDYDNYPNGEITKNTMISIMVGDTKRIEAYPIKGFTASVPMPKSVKDAMEYLITCGYADQLPL